jgi:hypothetical protein
MTWFHVGKSVGMYNRHQIQVLNKSRDMSFGSLNVFVPITYCSSYETDHGAGSAYQKKFGVSGLYRFSHYQKCIVS